MGSSWFSFMRCLFIAATRQNTEKERKGRWVLGRRKLKKLNSSRSIERSSEKEEGEAEQGKNAVILTIATAAAAAQVAAEVVRIAEISLPGPRSKKSRALDLLGTAPPSTPRTDELGIQVLAAIKIQTAFRGYLARKALRALRGLVKLQAIIRGRAVRRQAVTTLKCLQSVVNIQSQVCARRIQMVEATPEDQNKELHDFRDKVMKIDSSSHRRWDDSLLSKDEANALFLSKREAVIKRERIKEYSLIHRRSAESEQNKLNGRWRYWLEQWVDTQLSKNPDTVFPSKERIREEYGGQIKLRSSQKGYHVEGLDSPISVTRRSFHHKKQKSFGDDNNGFASSPVVPTYMAATESAKAKARSLSSPRLRMVNLDACSQTNSPYKHKLSPISSINSEVTGSSRIYSQRSPCLKGLPSRVQSNRSMKDLSFDESQCSLRNWDPSGAFS